MAQSSPMPVVCAVIERDGQILIAQRPGHKLLPFKWEFPGGKVETGEPPARAIEREIREELGCEIEIFQAAPGFDHDYGTVVITMLPFFCRLARGSPEPVAHEHVSLRWVSTGELAGFDLAAADIPVVAAYHAMIQSRP